MLVTAALPYVNARLHLGHLRSTYIPADVYVRYLRLKGEEAIFVCASDEHGSPIAVGAEKEGITPKDLIDRYHKLAYDDLRKMGCSFDVYSRTSLPIHHETAQRIFMDIYEKGYIFEQEIEQLFCQKCQRFLPDRYVNGVCRFCRFEGARGDECPSCGRFLKPTDLIDPYCTSCGSTPTVKKAKHWFFKLSDFQAFLEKWVEEANLSKLAKTYALGWLREGLKDWCISRDLDWGVPLPLKKVKEKVLYVWFDAPIGYISSTKVWARNMGEENRWREFWQSDGAKIVHFIGKGIIYHHTLFWPAMLKASGNFNLPTAIVAGGYYTLEGRKMSKSEGWVIEVVDYLKTFEPDLLRYYLIASAPLDRDSDFSWMDFMKKCNHELVDTLGNYIHRTLTFIYNNFGGAIPQPTNLDDYDRLMLEAIRSTHEKMIDFMDHFNFYLAIRSLMQLASDGNRFLSDKEPWKLIKRDPTRAATCTYVCAQIVKALSIWMVPFLPFTAGKLRTMLKLEGKPSLSEALRELPPRHVIGKPEILFKKVEREKIEALVRAQKN